MRYSKKRLEKFKKQQEKYGFDERETYSLYQTVAEFIHPRLKMLRKLHCDFPSKIGSIEKWDQYLDEMIWLFESISKDGNCIKDSDKDRAEKAWNLFCEYYRDLWW